MSRSPLPTTAAIFDALEQHRRSLPEPCRDLATFVDRSRRAPAMTPSARDQPTVEGVFSGACPTRSDASSKPALSRRRLGRVMGAIGVGAATIGVLILALGAPVYAAFMATICSWIGGCALVSHLTTVTDSI